MRIASLTVLTALLTALTTGCGEPGANGQTQGKAPSAKTEAPTTKGEGAGPRNAATDTLTRPLPQGGQDDPRAIAATQKSDAVLDGLKAIRARLASLKSALAGQPKAESEIKAVAAELKEKADGARRDCDDLIRRVEDLRTELGHAKEAYAAVAEQMRTRAKETKDPTLRKIRDDYAAELDRLSADAPRRHKVAGEFLVSLREWRASLAEMVGVLGDTQAVIAILSVEPNRPLGVSEESRLFQTRLQQFITVILEYQKLLFPPPPEVKAPRAALQPGPQLPPDHPLHTWAVTEIKGWHEKPAEKNGGVWCKECQGYHTAMSRDVRAALRLIDIPASELPPLGHPRPDNHKQQDGDPPVYIYEHYTSTPGKYRSVTYWWCPTCKDYRNREEFFVGNGVARHIRCR